MGFWDPPPYSSPSFFGEPNAGKPRLHELPLPTDLKIIPLYLSPARETFFLDRLVRGASSRRRPRLEGRWNIAQCWSVTLQSRSGLVPVPVCAVNDNKLFFFFFFRGRYPGFVCFLVGVEVGFLSHVSPGFALGRPMPPPTSPPPRPRPLRAGPAPHAARCPRRRSPPPPGTPGASARRRAPSPAGAPLATCTYSGLPVLTWSQLWRKLAVLPALSAHGAELRSHGDPGVGGWVGPAGPALWGRCVDCRRSG